MPPKEMSEAQAKRVAAISRTPVTLLPVDSSQISHIGHDPNTNTLAIRFQPKAEGGAGSLYHYANVDTAMFGDFRTAKSLGSYHYNHIKPNPELYPYVKLEDDKPPQEQEAA